MRRVKLTVAFFATDPDGDLPDPIEMLRPAIQWLREHGYLSEDDELSLSSGGRPAKNPTYAYAILTTTIELRRPLSSLDPGDDVREVVDGILGGKAGE